MNTFKIYGNHGTLTIDIKTGKVLSYEPDETDSYKDIVKIDIDEWEKNSGEKITKGTWDILDFGFWTDVGKYFKPMPEYRIYKD